VAAVPGVAGAASGALPLQGVLVPGEHLGGIHLGDSAADVRASWGSSYQRCTVCALPTWMYLYARGVRGAAVSFRNGRVVAIFTLGTPFGWRTTRGVRLGDPAKNIQAVYGRLRWTRCIGYGALSVRTKSAVTSIYTYGELVYGFALTRPSEPVCQ
jgi:hypothetical protein